MSRGGYIHNRVLLDPIEASFRARGASASREYPVKLGRRLGFVDLFVLLGCLRIAIEVELSPKRVDKDVEKAEALRARWLLIVTPRQRIAQACARRLKGMRPHPNLTIIFLTLGTAVEWVANCFPLMTQPNDFQKRNHQPALPAMATKAAANQISPHRKFHPKP